MFNLWNRTNWAAGIYPTHTHRSEPVFAIAVKAGFAIDTTTGTLKPLSKPPAIEITDRHQGEPMKTSLVAASETSPPKALAEYYVLNAKALPPAPDATVMEVIVALTAANGKTHTKTLRILGKRTWKGMGALPTISKPDLLRALALDYEHAFGGVDAKAHPKQEKFYPRNWIGKGFVNEGRKCIGIELPNIEVAPFIKSPEDRPAPAGFGPLAGFWSPRLEAQGNIPNDGAERAGDAPYGPDAEPTVFNSAPLDQRFEKPFHGGELLQLTNLLPGLAYGKTVSLRLPAFSPTLELRRAGSSQTLAAVCDTLVIDAQKKELYLIARVTIPVARFRPGIIGDVTVYAPETIHATAPQMKERAS